MTSAPEKDNRTKLAAGLKIIPFDPTHLPLTIGPHIRGMFGPRITTVFTSRWRAIWFAASICLLAYCSVPQQSATPPANNNKAIAQAVFSDDPFAQGANSADADTSDITDAAHSDDVKRVQALLDQMQAPQ